MFNSFTYTTSDPLVPLLPSPWEVERQYRELWEAAVKREEKLRAMVERIAADKNLRTRKAGYHARRTALECGAVLAELDGMYQKEQRDADE